MIFAVIAGCGGSSQGLQPVTGKVTLDGQPLAGTTVEFQPSARGGSPSYGETDAGGAFKLRFTIDKEGAMLGDHIVRISKFEPTNSPTGKETLPAKYNSKSKLTATVTQGHNTIDFPLSRNGGTPQESGRGKQPDESGRKSP